MAEAGLSLLASGAGNAIGKAIARRWLSASSSITTAQPGRTNRPPRPARPLLTWQPDSEPSSAENVKAVVRTAVAARSGLGDCTVAPSLLERSFHASNHTSCVGTGPYRGSSRFSITGCRSAGRSGHLAAAGTGAAATRFYEGGAGRQGPSRSALGHRPAEIDIAPLADARAQAGVAD